jgi:hypothetical protein
MGNYRKFVALLSLLAVAGPLAVARPAAGEERSVIIVFKDGHQQKFPLDEIARIEFSTPMSASAVSRGRFQGDWKVGVGDGSSSTFIISLKSDGRAHKSMGSGNGTWEVVNGEARISWDDGWHDILRKVGRKYQKIAFSPGTTYEDQPANVTEAVYTEPN